MKIFLNVIIAQRYGIHTVQEVTRQYQCTYQFTVVPILQKATAHHNLKIFENVLTALKWQGKLIFPNYTATHGA